MSTKRINQGTGAIFGLLLLLASSLALAAPGGNSGKGGGGGGGGGSGGGDSGTDPCTDTTSFFPSIAYVVSNSTRKKTEQVIYLASADGACARAVATLTESVVDGTLRLHVREDGSETGFLVVLERQHYTYRILVREFQVATGNVVNITDTNVLLERTWFPDSQTGTVLTEIGLSPDGERLLITSEKMDTSGGDSRVLSCPLAIPLAIPCTPEILLTSVVEDGSYWFWAAAPSADPARFFVAITYEGAVAFPRYHLVIASREEDGTWTLATDAPLTRSDNSVFYPDAHPYDSNQVAWNDTGNMSMPATVHVCAITSDGACGVDSWALTDARLPTWSRQGRLAQPVQEMPSLLFRGLTSNGKIIHYETYNGLVLEPLAVPSSLRWDAY